MRLSGVVSRRAVLAFVAAIGMSAVLGTAAQAKAKKAPDIKGHWEGVIHWQGFGDMPFTLDVTEESKNGKFEGTATTPGQDPYHVSGKISPKRKVKATYEGTLNGQPTTVTLNVTVSRDRQSADGTVVGKDDNGNTVVSGIVEMQKTPDEG